jgi:hypothetical protein
MWGWVHIIHQLTNGSYLEREKLLKVPIYEALTDLCYFLDKAEDDRRTALKKHLG